MVTIKQKIVAKDLSENIGKPIGRAMLDAGYAPITAKTPKRLTESKGWEKLMENYLPDKDFVTIHKGGLHATKIHSSPTEPDKEVPDWGNRHKYLETGYRLKRRLQDSNIVGQQTNILVLPSELLDKYGITPDTKNSSKG